MPCDYYHPHAQVFGWLNLWPNFASEAPVHAGVNLYPLERAFYLAGQEVAPPGEELDEEEEGREWLRQLN